MLANMIRQNKNIKGYFIKEKETKLTQFADDTSIVLDGTKKSFQYCIETILEYAKYSGLSMNFDKTKVIWFGCEHPPDVIYLPHLNFEWNPKSFQLLGIEFTVDLKNITDKNIRKKFTEITNELNKWSKRDLTPFGRITVLKTLVVSKIVNILISLPSPSLQVTNELDKLFYSFLWNGKPDQIKRSVATLKLNQAGLGMLNLKLFDQSLKITWVRKYLTSVTTWKDLLDLENPNFNKIFLFGDKYKDTILTTVTNPFWIDVINHYYSFYSKYVFKNVNEVESTSFLFNTKITVGNKIISNKSLIDKDIYYIYQLKTNGQFLNFQEFNAKFNLRLNFLQYTSIINSIKTYLRKCSKLKSQNEIKCQSPVNKILMNKRGASSIYKELIISNQDITGLERWKKISHITTNNYYNAFKKNQKIGGKIKIKPSGVRNA